MLPWKTGLLLHQQHHDKSTSSGNSFLCSFFIVELQNYRISWLGKDPQEPSQPCWGWSCVVVALGLVLLAHSSAEEPLHLKESAGDPHHSGLRFPSPSVAAFHPDTLNFLWGCIFPWLSSQPVTHVLCGMVQPLFPCTIQSLWGLCDPLVFPLATGAPVRPRLSVKQPKRSFGGQQVFLVCGTLMDIDCLSCRLSKAINPWIWKSSTPRWSSRASTGCQEAE